MLALAVGLAIGFVTILVVALVATLQVPSAALATILPILSRGLRSENAATLAGFGFGFHALLRSRISAFEIPCPLKDGFQRGDVAMCDVD